jgi:hypothetical protein
MTVSKQILSVLVTALAVLAFSIAPAQAKKPDNPGGGNGGGPGQNVGGLIYFRFDTDIYTMNDDGSDMTVVASYPDGLYATYPVPSRQLYGGKRWFPLWSGQELFGLSDAGEVVSLHNDPQLEKTGSVTWQVGDEAISWTGRRRDNTGAVVEGGIYSTPVTFDGAGNIASAGTTELLVSLPLVDDIGGSLTPDIIWHDWSPDGTQFVYDTHSYETVIADLSGTIDTVIADTWDPRWSPAGDKLMAKYPGRRSHVVGVMNLDGSQRKSIASDGISWEYEPGVWSPTGSHLTFLREDYTFTDSYISRATADGKGKRRLTDSSVATGIYQLKPLGWRDVSAAAPPVPEPQAATIVVIGLSTLLGVWRRRGTSKC